MWFARSALLALGALSFVACGTGEPGVSNVSDTEQAADGCGAYRYRGSGNVFCTYTGSATGTVTAQNTVGTCLNDSQLECAFNGMQCEWGSPSSATNCLGDTGNLCAAYPPEASLQNPSKYVRVLGSGDTLCDPPASAAQLAAACVSVWNDYWVRREISEQCSDQTSSNSGGVTCCLSCANPTPLPQLEPGDECADGDCGCPLEEEPGGGSGSSSGSGSAIPAP